MNKIRKMTKTFRTIIFLVILFSLPLVLIYDLRLVMRDDTVAQRIVVEYLNKHTNNDEMVAVNPSLIPPLECNAIPHEIVAFYVGKNPQFLYEDAETMLSRYRTDVNLSYFKYFVVDPRLSLGSYPNDFVVLEILTRSWLYVGGVGDNLIFLNPSYAIEELESIVHINSTENLKYAYGLNVEEPTIGSNGGIHFAAKSKVVKGWCFWKLKLQKPIDTSEGAIFAIKYKTNDAKIRVVAKFIHGRDEEVPGWFTDAQPPTSEYRISIHELSGNYTLSAVILGFDWAEHWVWGETRRELHIDFLSFNKGIGVKLSD